MTLISEYISQVLDEVSKSPQGWIDLETVIMLMMAEGYEFEKSDIPKIKDELNRQAGHYIFDVDGELEEIWCTRYIDPCQLMAEVNMYS